MKNVLLAICLLLISLKSYSQDSRTIYIEVQGLSIERGFPELHQLITGLPEVLKVRYCEKLGLAIVDVHHDSLSTENKLKVILRKSNYRFFIKQNIPPHLLPDVCKLNAE